MGKWGIVPSFAALLIAPRAHIFYAQKTIMTANINNFGVINFYENHSKQKNENKQAETEDITPVQEVEPEQKSDPFPYFTQKCFDENRVTSVDAEIQAARKGTAETMWRTLWNNENLGYLEVEPIDATTLYRAIEKHYGKLPYTERNFRGARSKR